MDDLFRPPTAQWRGLSPRYLTLKLVLIGIVWPLLIAAVVVPLFLFMRDQPFGWISLAVGVLIWIWRFVRAPRAFRRWGYAETDSDVYLTSGLMWRSLSCVPYGRMQLVDVNSGPLERAFGLASVRMVTSSTSGTINIPGLSQADATELRDRLITRGELLQAGI